MGKRKRTSGRGRKGRGGKRRKGNNGKRAMRSVAKKQVYPFKRFTTATVLTGSNVVGGNGVVQGQRVFKLDDLTGYTEFVNLFDQYKIAAVKFRFRIVRDPSTLATGQFPDPASTVGVYPILRFVRDYDDTSVATLNELYQYPGMKEIVFSPDKPCSRWYYMKPARLDVGFESTVNSSYHPVWKGFIDMASVTTPYYGLKYTSEQLWGNQFIVLECYYYLVCKNVR